MISDVDASISALLRAEALPGTETEVVFDAPTTEWASRRSGPVVDVFLYDIREDPARRDIAMQPQRDMTGRITGRKPGVRHFRLSYLLTAWTKRPEDEHRLLGQLLEALLQYDRVPESYLRGRFQDETIVLSMAQPSAPDRSLADIWNALGGEMKPSLDLVAVAPVRPARSYPAGPPVLEPQVRVLRRPDPRAATAAGPGEAERS
jgi:Pvc16 N-terminal domain